jgi:two-component system, sensor histidine kinase and response regulator
MPRTFDEKELLDRIDNDWEFLGDATRMLAADAPLLLADIRRAVQSGDATLVGSAGHTLKGMISNFCAPDAQASAMAVEQIGKGGDLSNAAPTLHELETHLNALIVELTEYVAIRA